MLSAGCLHDGKLILGDGACFAAAFVERSITSFVVDFSNMACRFDVGEISTSWIDKSSTFTKWKRQCGRLRGEKRYTVGKLSHLRREKAKRPV